MFQLPNLPYPYGALAPVVSDLTMRTHHDKHHRAYVDTTNTLARNPAVQAKSMEEVVRFAKGGGDQALFNASGQAWNHAFFWECMTPDHVSPSGPLADAITGSFGGLEGLKAKFIAEGAGHFASGWVWLIATAGALEVVSTHDADSVLVREGSTPLLVCDVWEHAYYLDYRNLRKDYLTAWFDTLANWRFAATQLAAATEGAGGYRYPAPVTDAA